MHLSIIIPVFNEEENLPILNNSIHTVMDERVDIDWEVIYVDDGSTDNSLDVIRNIVEANPKRISGIAFRRNFGQTAAVSAGIDFAKGDVIILMDADLQNDPVDIPMLLDKINEGYDVVSGWRVNRQDTYLTRVLPSQIANWLISKVTGVHLHDYGCTLKAYRREVLTGFHLYGEMHRFIPAYASSVGARITEVPVHHHPRKYGTTKYGLNRTIKVLLDLFTVKFMLSYSQKPIYLFGGTGLVLILGSGLLLLFLMLRRLLAGISVLSSPLFQMSTMFFILGFQSILMGLIAELLVRTYHESQSKPIYTIREIIHQDENDK